MKILKLFFIIFLIFSFNHLKASNEDMKNKITKNIIPNVAHAYSAFTIIQFIRLGLQYNKKNKVIIKKIIQIGSGL